MPEPYTFHHVVDISAVTTWLKILLMRVNMNGMKKVFKGMPKIFLFIFMSGCTATPETIFNKTSPSAEAQGQKVSSGQKGTVFLIASSSQYDENVIPEIETAFSRQCYAVDKRYFDQSGVVSGKLPKFCGLPFLVIFRNPNDAISNPLSQSLHPFRKAKISRILQADVVHLHL